MVCVISIVYSSGWFDILILNVELRDYEREVLLIFSGVM